MVGSRASRECADTLNNSTGTTEVTHRLARRTTGRTDLTPTLRDVSSDAPEVPTTSDTNARAVLARRVEFIMIGIGGVFIILGWGIGHQEWARALGWAFTGVGFAIELVYGKVLKPSRTAAKPEPEPLATDESKS